MGEKRLRKALLSRFSRSRRIACQAQPAAVAARPAKLTITPSAKPAGISPLSGVSGRANTAASVPATISARQATQ